MPKIAPKLLTRIKASELSLDDEFMRYEPVSRKGQNLKNSLEILIRNNPKDFYRPVIDPTFTEDGEFTYTPGAQPAMGKTYAWWEEHAKALWPERRSRLGTKSEYLSFLAVLIKKLVEGGMEICHAWDIVCNNSSELGNYKRPSDTKQNYNLEPTGSREVCGFYDLSNVYKILAEDNYDNGFWAASGECTEEANVFPLAEIDHFTGRYTPLFFGTGWIILEK